LAIPALVFTGASRVLAVGASPHQSPRLSASHNPRANVAPTPNFQYSGRCSSERGSWHCANPCVSGQLHFPAYSDAHGCADYVLRALNAARRAEFRGPMVLPRNWFHLTVAQQLFVLADLERTARGLPPYLGLNARLSAEARRSASNNTDPGVARGFAVANDRGGVPAMGAAWASTFSTLGADYLWMYTDGWGGNPARTSNLSCTSSRAKGCWSHRDQLLGADPGTNPGVGLLCRNCEMGAAVSIAKGTTSLVDLIERPAHGAPPMTFTWSRDVVPFLTSPVRPAVKSVPTSASRAALRHLAATRHAAMHSHWPQWSTRAAGTTSCHRSHHASPNGHLVCRTKTSKRTGK